MHVDGLFWNAVSVELQRGAFGSGPQVSREKRPYLYVDVHGALSSAEVSTLLFFRAFSAACELWWLPHMPSRQHLANALLTFSRQPGHACWHLECIYGSHFGSEAPFSYTQCLFQSAELPPLQWGWVGTAWMPCLMRWLSLSLLARARQGHERSVLLCQDSAPLWKAHEAELSSTDPHSVCPFPLQGVCHVQFRQGVLLWASQLHHPQLCTRVPLPSQAGTQEQKLAHLAVEGE